MPKQSFNLALLEWIALIPWFLAINNENRFRAFFISLWTGIFFWGITIYWLRLVTGLGFFLLIFYLGLYFAVFGLCMSYISCKKIRHSVFFLGPILWILLELLRGFLMGGFPWLNLCHGQYLNIMLIQWASVAGENIVSGILILINMFGAEIILNRGRKRYLLGAAAVIILIFIHGVGSFMLRSIPDKNEFLRVSVIQPNIIEEKWDKMSVEKNFNILLELSYKSLEENPGFIIWPETSSGSDLESDKIHLEKLKEFSSGYNVYLLVGSVRDAGSGKFYNRALVISPKDEICSYDKLKLVPFGEYVPMARRFPGFKRWVEEMAGYRFSFVSGETGNLLSINKASFGVLICFEDIFPFLSRRYKNMGAKILVNMTDDHWFGRSPAPYQHLAGSVFRAVENRLPLVRAANSGVSAFIDSTGRIAGMVKDKNSAIFIRGYCVREISL